MGFTGEGGVYPTVTENDLEIFPREPIKVFGSLNGSAGF